MNKLVEHNMHEEYNRGVADERARVVRILRGLQLYARDMQATDPERYKEVELSYMFARMNIVGKPNPFMQSFIDRIE